MSLFRVLHFDICSGRRLTFGADDVGRRLEQIRIIWKRFSSISSRKALKIPYNKQLPRPFLWWSIEISENKILPRQSRTFHFHSGENLKLTRKERVNSSHTHGATKNISNRISARIAGQLRGGYNVVELYPRQSATIQRGEGPIDNKSFSGESFPWWCEWRFSFSSSLHEKRKLEET